MCLKLFLFWMKDNKSKLNENLTWNVRISGFHNFMRFFTEMCFFFKMKETVSNNKNK